MLMDIGKFNKYKIYITYQDVDVAGVVYFANYFNYAEKARSLFIKEIFGSILFRFKADLINFEII
jgi:acyl-CoA thioesterase FadM